MTQIHAVCTRQRSLRDVLHVVLFCKKTLVNCLDTLATSNWFEMGGIAPCGGFEA
jgi:hypothetical protein